MPDNDCRGCRGRQGHPGRRPLWHDPGVTRLVPDYTLRRSARARNARLNIRPDGELVVTLPARAPERWATELLEARSDWVDRHRSRILAEAARPRYGGAGPGARAGADQPSRWGSASRRGTVSFNWRLVLTPAAVLDYVVVHELAHLREFGHGRGFWRLVRDHVPEADAARRWLRAHEPELRAALDR